MPGMRRDEIRFRSISGGLITSRKSIAMRSTFAAFDYLCMTFFITS